MLNLIPSGELTFCHGKLPFLMGKSTISMAIFNCKLLVHQRVLAKAMDMVPQDMVKETKFGEPKATNLLGRVLYHYFWGFSIIGHYIIIYNYIIYIII